MDPVDTKDERVADLRAMVATIIGELDQGLSLHDFRVVFGEQRSNLIFDLVVPYAIKDAEALKSEIEKKIQEVNPHLFAVITVDREWS
jgi:hypothetical protein